MKHTLSDSDITILKHILFVAEKPAKTVHFCFMKGKEQAYITPRKDLLVTFNLSNPIKFDYPIANVRTFLAQATNVVDPSSNSCDVNKLVLPSRGDIENFQTKIVEEIPFSYDDYKTNLKQKYKFLNVMGIDKKIVYRYQNHYRNWWFSDGDKVDIMKGKSSRKYRYVIGRDKLRLLPNHYNLIIRERSDTHPYGVLQFQHKHLNYFFNPQVSWTKQSVRDWTDASDLISDEHLIEQYIKKGYMETDKVSASTLEISLERYTDDLSSVSDYLDDMNFQQVKTKYTKGDDWTALSLHGYGENAVDILKPNVLKSKVKIDTKLQWTTLSTATQLKPVIEILDRLPCDFERVRFMKLKVGTVIGKHTDKVDKDIVDKKIVRLHIPIRTNNDVVFNLYENTKDTTGEEHNLKTGHYYYIDVSKPHAVSNQSDVDRYHLVVDCFVNDKLRTLLGWPSEISSDKLIHAKEDDFETVKRIFYENRKLFPHIRKDYIKGMIKRGTVVLENDVVIIYNFYKRNYKVGNVQSKKGDVVLSQIVAKNRDGSASKVLQRFFNHVKKPVYLTVRQDNEIARQFYLKNNMKLVGETSWVKGTMLGDVYLYEQ